MSREKLTEALLGMSDARARVFWRDAELQADRYRQEAEQRYASRRKEVETQHEAELTQQLDRLSNQVEKRVQRIRLLAEETFSEQLHRLALEQLTSLPTEKRVHALRQLAAELPELDWQLITVHPDDRQQASKLFSGCAINSDPMLVGGLIAATTDGAVCVNNSLSRRLEQVWPKLCGSLLDTLQQAEGISDAEPAA